MKNAIFLGIFWVTCFLALALFSLSVDAQPAKGHTAFGKTVQIKVLLGTNAHISSVFIVPSQLPQKISVMRRK